MKLYLNDSVNSGVKVVETALKNLLKLDSKVAKQDALGVPEGSLQVISPEIIRQDFPEYFFADRGIPENPMRAAGSQEIVYQRVGYIGALAPARTGGNNGRGKIDINLQPIKYGTERYKGFFEVSHEEVDRLSFLQANNNVLGQIDLLAEKRQAAIEAAYQTMNDIFSYGNIAKGIYGALNHPDLPRITLATPFGPGRTFAQNLATLALMEKSISVRSKNKYKPTSLLLGNVYHDLKQQYESGTSDSVLARFLANSYSVKEIELVPELELDKYNEGYDYALMYTREADKVERCITKDITFMPPLPCEDGVKVVFNLELSGVHYKRAASAVLLEYPKA